MTKTMEEGNETPKLSPANLLSLPEEVFYRHIFNKLEYADILRLRRTCAPIKVYCDDFIRNNFKNHVREINESDFTLRHFLAANLPTNSIFLNNCSPSFFEDPLIPSFLQLYGDLITHLRIHHFGTFISPPELHFFSSLPNLLHLDLDFIDATKRDCMTSHKTVKGIKIPREKSPFPENFKNLKTLKLNEVQGSQKNDLGYAWDFIEFCQNLEYVKHPLYKDKDLGQPGHPNGVFGCVIDYIKRRHENHPDEPNLKFYDLEHVREGHEYFGLKPDNLAGLCEQLNVKLLNVYGDLFVKPYARLGYKVPFFPKPLVSLVNIHAFAFSEELPNLKKLLIDDGVGSCSFAETYRWSRREGSDEVNMAPVETPKWPNLEVLDLMIDYREMSGDDFMPESLTKDFLNFLFGRATGKKREKMRELALRFSSNLYFNVYDKNQIPIPKAKDITVTCPNLTKLTLKNWMGLNKDLLRFWEGLPLLEEVELEKCEKMGNVAFVGTETKDPVFLKLKNLRKVSLKGLDSMPKITDLVFDLVFRHLKIKRFCLTSEKSVKSVTTKGIESLLTGEFNNSVEKFSFDGWSLDGVSVEALMELKLKFRATHML